MFYALEIEQCPGLGFIGGPEFSTNIQVIASGREKRNPDWSICRHKYTAAFANISDEGFRAIKKVFLMMRGRLHTFLFKDWSDFQALNEQFAIGDGSTTVFQLRKTSLDVSSGAEYDRIITKPDLGVVVEASGVVDPTAVVSSLDGTVTFLSAPANHAVLTWSGTFKVQVRFDIDYMPFSLDNRNHLAYVTNGSVDIIEVLDE
jgi:uncharacterized protein (TIGR02217 family)